MDIAVFSFNDKNEYIEINSRLCGLTGYEKEEIFLCNFPEPFWPDTFFSKIQNEINFFKSTGKLKIESFFMRKNKTYFPVKIYGGIIPADDKNPKEYVIFTEDISNLKKAERELKLSQEMLLSLNKNLEKLVDKKTKELKIVMKQKNEFINQLGHDLKNPLNPMINILPILEQNENDPEKKKMLQIINRNASYMYNLIIKMIKLAKLDSLEIKFDYEKINIKKEIEEILINNIKSKNKKNIMITNQIENDICIDADIIHFQELIINIIDNAIKYGRENGVINIDCNRIDDRSIQIKITDNGIGMSDEQLQNIFKDFYKLDPTDSITKSSGLGMPICQRIVTKHNGKIWVESPGIGKGTSVVLTLPIKQQSVDKENMEDTLKEIAVDRSYLKIN
jgi:PAS domain S-box-containing protein